jgi:hypothetical protein
VHGHIEEETKRNKERFIHDKTYPHSDCGIGFGDDDRHARAGKDVCLLLGSIA